MIVSADECAPGSQAPRSSDRSHDWSEEKDVGRFTLIDKEIGGQLTSAVAGEPAILQHEMDLFLQQVGALERRLTESWKTNKIAT